MLTVKCVAWKEMNQIETKKGKNRFIYNFWKNLKSIQFNSTALQPQFSYIPKEIREQLLEKWNVFIRSFAKPWRENIISMPINIVLISFPVAMIKHPVKSNLREKEIFTFRLKWKAMIIFKWEDFQGKVLHRNVNW